MKKIIFVSLFIFSATAISACPYCGCGNSNFQIGVLPNFTKAFIGVRYSYSHFQTDSASQFSRDYFHTTELWGGYTAGRFQVMAFVPYLSIHKRSDDGVINSTGLGDVLLLVNYQLLRTPKDSARATQHSLWVGGGIKLKTGQSAVDINNPDFTIGDFSGTPGTGSTDYVVNANYMLTGARHGWVTNIAYRINTQNSQQYRYGNKFYLTSSYFYSLTAGAFTLRPLVGVNLLMNHANSFQGSEIPDSQGYILSGQFGVNVQRGKVGLLVNESLPLAQEIFKGLTQFKSRASIALTFSF